MILEEFNMYIVELEVLITDKIAVCIFNTYNHHSV